MWYKYIDRRNSVLLLCTIKVCKVNKIVLKRKLHSEVIR